MIAALPFFVVLIMSGAFLLYGDFLSICAIIFGYLIGLYVYSQMLLPLIYGLPLSVYYFIKKKVRFTAILSDIASPVIWLIILSVFGIIFHNLTPSFLDFLVNSNEFNFGGLLAILSLLLNFLTKKGQSDMWNEYQTSTLNRFTTYRSSGGNP
jgi:hypothetical protein